MHRPQLIVAAGSIGHVRAPRISGKARGTEKAIKGGGLPPSGLQVSFEQGLRLCMKWFVCLLEPPCRRNQGPKFVGTHGSSVSVAEKSSNGSIRPERNPD